MTARTSLHKWADTVWNTPLGKKETSKCPAWDRCISSWSMISCTPWERPPEPFSHWAIQLEAERTPKAGRLNGKCAVQNPAFSREIHGKPSNSTGSYRARNEYKNVTWKIWKQVKACTAWHLEWISMTSLQIVGYRCLPCTLQLLQPGQTVQDSWQDTQAWTVWAVLSSEKRIKEIL